VRLTTVASSAASRTNHPAPVRAGNIKLNIGNKISELRPSTSDLRLSTRC
jgi:hypothetical protein